MDNAGHPAAAAGVYVYYRTGNGPGTDQEPKAGSHSVGNPLPQNFTVTVMLGVGHVIHNQRRQQRFNGTQQRQS